MIKASAPGKIILFGEHAVVYGRPAVAAPVSQVRATAVVQPNPDPGVRLIAPDLAADFRLETAPPDDAADPIDPADPTDPADAADPAESR